MTSRSTDSRTTEPAVGRGTAAVAVGAAVAALAVSFLVVGVSRSWVVFAVAQTLFAFTPDALVTVGIQRLGDAAQPLLVVLAAAVSVAVFAGLTLATLAVAAAAERERPETVFAVGVVVTVAGFLLTVAPVAALAGGVVAGLVVGLAGVEAASDSPTRRRLLRSLGTAVVALGVGSTVGGYRLAAAGTAADDERGRRETTDPVVRELLAAAERRSLDVPGVEGLVSTDFYRVDINTVDPRVDPDDWSLTVTDTTTEGTELTVSLSELRAYEAQHRFVSLRCVGDKLNGEKLDTALWTGVPVRTLLADANTERTGNCCVYVRAADDYYQEFPLSALSDAILVYGMNGGPLPRGHGAPVRLLVPGHWGEINVKWITAIELRDEPARGYWEKRGWHGTGPVNTVAKLHGVETDDGTVTVGGHAYAGTRGIDRVEVSTDDGETWTEASLSDPLPGRVSADSESKTPVDSEPKTPAHSESKTPAHSEPKTSDDSDTDVSSPTDTSTLRDTLSPTDTSTLRDTSSPTDTSTLTDTSSPTDASTLTDALTDEHAVDAARMWRHEYEATQRHEVLVRAVEADGTVQPRGEGNGRPFPSGATGWVSRTVDP